MAWDIEVTVTEATIFPFGTEGYDAEASMRNYADKLLAAIGDAFRDASVTVHGRLNGIADIYATPNQNREFDGESDEAAEESISQIIERVRIGRGAEWIVLAR